MLILARNTAEATGIAEQHHCALHQNSHTTPAAFTCHGCSVASATDRCSKWAVAWEMPNPLIRLHGLSALTMRRPWWGHQMKGVICKDLHSGLDVCLCRRSRWNLHVSLQSQNYMLRLSWNLTAEHFIAPKTWQTGSSCLPYPVHDKH